ncbi:MAG: ABC transporter permease [Desulfurococcales archaeon]|nr:ABC transporter permease [Desulfurococcales archaeon]
MKWVLIKILNLIIVLIIVTFIVAAIFTGPLAEREKQNIAQTVRQQARVLFQNQPPVAIARSCVLRPNIGEQGLIEAINTSIQSVIESGNTTLPQQLSQDQIAVLEQVLQSVIVDAVNNKTIVTHDEFLNYTTAKAYAALQEQGINVSQTELRTFIDDVSAKLSEECKKKIIQDEINIQIVRKGLDKPWYVLAVRYTKTLITFQPLYSTVLTTQYWPYQGDRNALHIIMERIPYSVLLFTTSSILTLAFALPLALYAARRPGKTVDSTITAWSVFSVSMPWWWLAMVFIYLFTVKYNIFPSPYKPGGIDWTSITSILSMAALPVFTVTILSIGDTAYRIRNILLDVFNEDFVTVARAKGLPESMVLRKHVIRAAAPPLVTIVLFSIVLSVFSGAIITELIFNWFGLGRLYWDAIVANDIPVIVELTYITTLLYLVIRFILDILYTVLDPRIRRA